jgi:surfeit locus 1 family protein
MNPGKRSRWIIAVAALLAAGGTAALGLWQLDRAKQKIALASAITTRAALPPITPIQLAGSALAAGQYAGTPPPFEQQLEAQLERRIELSGRWLDQFSVYLDNRQMDGKPGFYLYTPLRLADGRVLMVQRGWWPRDGQDRTRVPSPPETKGVVTFIGRITRAPGRTFSLGSGGDTGRIRQNLAVVEYGRSVGLTVQPLLIVQLDADVDSGTDGDGDAAQVQQSAPPASGVPDLKRDWPKPAVDVDKHYGYATQWFALCALIVILYAWFQILRPRLRRQA